MDVKINREELIQVIVNLEVVEKLPRAVLQEFSKIFKADAGNPDLSGLVWSLQNKIADTICLEGYTLLNHRQGYKDYLQLPKFKAMGKQLNDKLNNLFKRVWEGYHNYRHREQLVQVRLQLDELLPTFTNSEQQVNFHLGLLKLYKESSLCQKKPIRHQKTTSQPFQQSSQQQRQQFPPVLNTSPPQNPAGQYPSNAFPPPFFHYHQPQQMTKIQAQEGNPYLMDKRSNQGQPGLLFEVPRFPMPSMLMPNRDGHGQGQYLQDKGINFMQRNMDKGQFMNYGPYRNKFGELFQNEYAHFFECYHFVQCPCQGKKGPQQLPNFKCSKCEFKYHYSCLRIYRSKLQTQILCPICCLRKQTIFCTIVQQPLKFTWHYQQRTKEVFNLSLTEEENVQINDAHRNGLDCQIRFLKIDGRSMGRDHYNGKQYEKQAGYSQITLPEESYGSAQLTMEIRLTSQQDQDKSPKLFLFSVLLIRMHNVQEIVLQLFDSEQFTGQDFYDQFISENGKAVVPLTELDDKHLQISYPVRGAQCNHVGVFDLKRYLEHVSNLSSPSNNHSDKILKCQICGKSCTAFKYDALLYRHIRGKKDYEENPPEAIEIYKDGKIQWVTKMVVQQEENILPEEDDSFLRVEEDSEEERRKDEEREG